MSTGSPWPSILTSYLESDEHFFLWAQDKSFQPWWASEAAILSVLSMEQLSRELLALQTLSLVDSMPKLTMIWVPLRLL